MLNHVKCEKLRNYMYFNLNQSIHCYSVQYISGKLSLFLLIFQKINKFGPLLIFFKCETITREEIIYVYASVSYSEQ